MTVSGEIELSPEQIHALDRIRDWRHRWDAEREQQLFRLFGYAGTGKTTLIEQAAADVNGEVVFATYTGKAASVMRSKGCKDACTLHSLLKNCIGKTGFEGVSLSSDIPNILAQKLRKGEQLDPKQKRILGSVIWNEIRQAGEHLTEYEKIGLIAHQIKMSFKPVKAFLKESDKPIFTDKESRAEHADLIIIDEVSMVGEDLGKRLLSFNKPVLVIGDPAQLQPVSKYENTGFFTEGVKPDVMLTKIHRQEAGDPIVPLATQAREYGVLVDGDYGVSELVGCRRFDPKRLLEADQVLVWKNETRWTTNQQIRQLLGRKGTLPEVGDKLCCLFNEQKGSGAKNRFYNGTLWFVVKVGAYDKKEHKLEVTLVPEMCEKGCKPEPRTLSINSEVFEYGGGEVTEGKYAEFTYGYAITVHKSQGSEWDYVILLDENIQKIHKRKPWLYTGVTRARKRITIVNH